jgi:hypothetical protein
MDNDKLFQLVRGSDPLTATIDSEEAPEALLERVLAESRTEPRHPISARRRRRKQFGFVAAALALGAVFGGLAVAGTGWLTGEPAPSTVVANFEAYTPELGFHPNPGGAVLVAQDGDISLYATSNQERTYCLILDEPWKPRTTLDGGTCVPAAIASGHLVAGILGGGPNRPDGHTTLVVGGRVDDPAASTVRFTSPTGEAVERPVGSSGFFLAGIDLQLPPCPSAGWTSTFTAVGDNGREIARTTVPLVQSHANGSVCVFSGLQR